MKVRGITCPLVTRQQRPSCCIRCCCRRHYSREQIGLATAEALHEAGDDPVERVDARQSAMIAVAEKLIGARKVARARDAKPAAER